MAVFPKNYVLTMIWPFSSTRLFSSRLLAGSKLASLISASLIFGFSSSAIAAPDLARESKNSKNDENENKKKGHKKKHIPSTVMSVNGLPEGELTWLLDKRKVKEAKKLLAESPNHVGDGTERKMWLASILCREHRFEESVEAFDKIPSLKTACTPILLMASSAYLEDQRYDQARMYANIVLDRCSKNTYDASVPLRAYETRAGSWAASGHLVEASADYEKCAIFDKTASPRFLSKAALMLVKANKAEQALQIIDRATKTERGRSNPNVYLVQGDCYKSLGRWKDAVVSVSKAIELSKAYCENAKKGGNFLLPMCYKERALCYEKLGQKALAQADLKELDKYSRDISDEMGAN